MTFEDDFIEVETPERVELSFPIAGLGSRFGAAIVDILIITLGYILLWILGAEIMLRFTSGDEYLLNVSRGILVFISFLLGNGYFIYFEYMWNGQTPGKRLTRTRVMKLGGLPVDLAAVVIRSFMRLVDILLFSITIGFFVLFMSKLSQRPGDYVAGTLVVRDRYITLKDLNIYLVDKQSEPLIKTATDKRFDKLDDEDTRLIRTFMDRRYLLKPDQRARMAENIALSLKLKLNIRDDEFETNEMLIRTAHDALDSSKGDW